MFFLKKLKNSKYYLSAKILLPLTCSTIEPDSVLLICNNL